MISTQHKSTSEEKGKSKGLLNVYFTAGYPELNSTAEILLGLQDAGVDFVELGLPYSDPLADGPTIQESGQTALDNGMNLDVLFNQLEEIKSKIYVPVYLMGYYNQWMQFGLDKFCRRCHDSGIYGLIIPDLPIDYFDKKHQEIVRENNLKISFLVTPQTSEERMRKVDELSTGFVYVVSSASTTGKQSGISDGQISYFNRIKDFGFKNKTLIGFGIHDNNSFELASDYSNGAIVGSAFIRHIRKDFSKENIALFIKSLRGK